MLKISKEKLAAYEKATTAEENTEVTAEVENEVDTAELEKEIRTLKVYADKCKRDLAYYSEKIVEYYGIIGKCEDFILQAYLDAEEAEKEAAAIEDEIANRKLIEVTDEIVTADAVDASVEAMTAVNFDLQAFNDDAPEVEDTATDELINTVRGYNEKIVAITAQLEALENERMKLIDERRDVICETNNHLDTLKEWVNSLVKAAFKDTQEITIVGISGVERQIVKQTDLYLFFDWETGVITVNNRIARLAIFDGVPALKAGIRELVKAIKRGDEKFTFPADTK